MLIFNSVTAIDPDTHIDWLVSPAALIGRLFACALQAAIIIRILKYRKDRVADQPNSSTLTTYSRDDVFDIAGPNAMDDVVQKAARMILRQLVTTRALPDNYVEPRYVGSDWCRGYIFGLTDGLLQDLKVRNQNECLATQAMVHISLMGQEAGARFFGISLKKQESGDFAEGSNKAMAELAGLQDRGVNPSALGERITMLASGGLGN